MIDIEPNLYFTRGMPFVGIISIPDDVPNGFFDGWDIKAQMRRHRDTTNLGLIAELEAIWADPGTNKEILLTYPETSHWPPCYAEYNALIIAPNGQPVHTEIVILQILARGTQHGN